ASFKARGLSAAVTVAKALGITTIALPTAGNAGGAAAAYAAHAGIKCVIAMPTDTPSAIILECRAFGADVHLIDGLISDCGAPIVKAFEHHAPNAEMWKNASTVAAGLRVPKPLGDFIILKDVYESGGEAVAATDDDLMDACRVMARLEGILAAPEGGAGLAA